MRTKRPAIFISIDSQFESHWEHFDRSLATNWPNHPEVLVVMHDTKGSLERKIRATNRYTVLDYSIESFAHSGPVMKHLEGKVNANTFYARLLLWSDIFHEYDTILHLDVDTLVLAPLDQLVNSDEFLIAPDQYEGSNYLFNDHSSRTLRKLLREDEIWIPTCQANAGIFSIPKRYRSEESFTEVLHLLHRYRDHLRWADQTLINIWMLKKRLQITDTLSWNFQARRFFESINALDTIQLLHFNGIPDPERVSVMEAAARAVKSKESWQVFIECLFPCSCPSRNELQKSVLMFRRNQHRSFPYSISSPAASDCYSGKTDAWIESEAA